MRNKISLLGYFFFAGPSEEKCLQLNLDFTSSPRHGDRYENNFGCLVGEASSFSRASAAVAAVRANGHETIKFRDFSLKLEKYFLPTRSSD